MTLGQRIQELRKQHGLSQEGLGERLGVSRQAISRWEMDGAVPEVDKLIAMSKLFEVSLGQLLGTEAEPVRRSGGKLVHRWLAGLTALCLALTAGLAALWSQNQVLARTLSMMDANYGEYDVALFQSVRYEVEELQLGFSAGEDQQPLSVELELIPAESMEGWKLTEVRFTDRAVTQPDPQRPDVSSLTRRGEVYHVSFTRPAYSGEQILAIALFTQKGTGLTAAQVVWSVEGRGEQGIVQELEIMDYWGNRPAATIPEGLALRLL